MIKASIKIAMTMGIAMVVIWWLNIPFLQSKTSDPFRIVVSHPILEDLTVALLGPDAHVDTLIKRAQNPLTAKKTDDATQMIQKADMIITFGTIADGPYQHIAPASKDVVLINIADQMAAFDLPNQQPYIWMSIVDWAKVVYVVQQQFKQQFPTKQSEINYRKDSYIKQLHVLQAYAKNQESSSPYQKGVYATNHDSLIPLATSIKKSVLLLDQQATTDTVLKQMKDNRIKAVFPNAQLPTGPVNQWADAALNHGHTVQVHPQVMTLTLDFPGTGRDTYINMMRQTIQVLLNN